MFNDEKNDSNTIENNNNNINENADSNIYSIENNEVLDNLIKLSGNQEVYKELKEENNPQTPGNPYFIEETDSIMPQSMIDIKVNTGNFVIQRENAKVYDIYEKIK